MLGYLEEFRCSRAASGSRIRSPGTSTAASTSSSGGTDAVAVSDGGNSSVCSSPIRSLLYRRQCRPITDVVAETQLKGSLIDRVDNLELRLLELEKDLVRKNERGEERDQERREMKGDQKKGKKKIRGFRKLVKSCVKGDLETKD